MTDPFDDLRRYANDLASEVSPFAAHRAVSAAMSPVAHRPRKVVVALVTTGLLGVSNVALAATADPAVPGDTLYKVDRAYERVVDLVGFGGPRVSERMLETGVLVERGEVAMALDLVQETLFKILESDDPHAALEELEAEAGSQPEAVATLVDIAKLIATGDMTGQDVSAQARQLRELLSQGQGQGPPDHAGPPEDRGPGEGNPSEDAPGQQNQP
jgi:hypothetical protein